MMFYDIKKKILILAFIFLIMPGLKASEIEKISTIMPYGTELLSQNESLEDGIGFIAAYKYGSTATKENILEFYQKFLLKEGYANTEKETNDKGSIFIFNKQERSVVVAILAQQENGLNIYHINLFELIQR